MRDGVTALAPGTSANVSQAELEKQVPMTRLLLLEAPPLTLSLPPCEDEQPAWLLLPRHQLPPSLFTSELQPRVTPGEAQGDLLC